MLSLADKIELAFADGKTKDILASFLLEITKENLQDELEFFSGIKYAIWEEKLKKAITIGEFRVLCQFFQLDVTVGCQAVQTQKDILETPFTTVAMMLRDTTAFHTDYWVAYEVSVYDMSGLENHRRSGSHTKSFAELKETIVGQDKALSDILFSIHTNFKIIEHNRTAHLPIPKQNLLITGGTGTGKTFTVERIAQQLDLALASFNCGELTEAGYVGKDLDDIIALLEEPYSTGKTVLLFLDEFDKLCTNTGDKKSVSTYGGQRALLKLLEGASLRADRHNVNKGLISEIDLSNVIIILGGAFQMFEEEEKHSASKAIGFGKQSIQDSPKEISEAQLVKAGIIPEIAGRIGQVVRLNKLNDTALREILLHSKESILKQFKMLAYYEGKRFSLTTAEIDRIIKESQELQLGVRGLSTLTEKVYIQQMLRGKQ